MLSITLCAVKGFWPSSLHQCVQMTEYAPCLKSTGFHVDSVTNHCGAAFNHIEIHHSDTHFIETTTQKYISNITQKESLKLIM